MLYTSGLTLPLNTMAKKINRNFKVRITNLNLKKTFSLESADSIHTVYSRYSAMMEKLGYEYVGTLSATTNTRVCIFHPSHLRRKARIEYRKAKANNTLPKQKSHPPRLKRTKANSAGPRSKSGRPPLRQSRIPRDLAYDVYVEITMLYDLASKNKSCV